MEASPEFKRIQKELLKEGRLYEDREFPASSRILYKDNRIPYIRWRRPGQITSNPKFIIKDATKFDLYQGDVGDCWFVAGVACLAATNKQLLYRVVPPDQSFEDDYTGMFRFNFWHFDRWVEVIIDDQLPTLSGRLLYAQNKHWEQSNEFWAALIEKAYAKLYGSYQNIHGGHINDALVDFTGGVSEQFNLDRKSEIPSNLFNLMWRTHQMASMMGCSISSNKLGEVDLGNGLYAGHAYSITAFAKVATTDIVRLRNPWGRDEWRGAWSDKSTEWRQVSESDKKKLGLVPKNDGEFWMSYDDWLSNFEDLNICHLYPDALTKEVAQNMNKRPWEVNKHHDKWIRGFNAGGCGNSPYEELFWTNPQFAVELKDTDDNDNDNKCTMIVSLMQKSEDMRNELYISFRVYKVRSGRAKLLDGENYEKWALRLQRQPPVYSNIRENTIHLELDPGIYVIVPSTYQPKKEGEFLLRIFTEKSASSGDLDTETTIPTLQPSEEDRTKLLFEKYTGGQSTMDADELQVALSEIYKDVAQRGFGIETSRSLLAMMDRNATGMLSLEEFRKMLKEVEVWKGAFKSFDKDRSNSIDSYELQKVFQAIGFQLSRTVMSSIIRRYGGKARRLKLEDFIHCSSRVIVMYGQFSKHKKDNDKAELTLNEWLAVTLLY